MKNKSIKTAVLFPVLTVLAAGVIILVIIIGGAASDMADGLTDELVEARVGEYVNEFEAFGNYGYAYINALAPAVNSIRTQSDNPRADVVNMLKSALSYENAIEALWTCWEPNAFDGKDAEFKDANDYHDKTGRFVPYIYKNGGKIESEALTGYDDPAEGDYYLGALNAKKPYITSPYPYFIGNKKYTVFSIAIPILQNGKVIGVVGTDINFKKVNDLLNAATILGDGYICLIAPNGVIATHKNDDLIMKSYKTTWLKNYAAQTDTILSKGGEFDINAYSGEIGADVKFTANAVQIGETGKNWAVCGFVPYDTITKTSDRMVYLASGVGIALVIIIALIIFWCVKNSLKRLPALTAMAERISKGDLKTDIESTGSEPTKNEITLLERSFEGVASVINTLITDINGLNNAFHVLGDIDARLDQTLFEGSYKTVVENINAFIANVIKDMLLELKLLDEFASGNFSVDIPRMPGKKAMINNAAERFKTAIRGLNNEIMTLAQDAANGLMSKANDEEYSGEWARLLKGLNALMDGITAPINEVLTVMSQIAQGNFDHQITGVYRGDFGAMKEAVNTTVVNIASYIDEISRVLMNMSQNNLNLEITREYVGAFAMIKDAINNIVLTFNGVISNISMSAQQVAAGAKAISESAMGIAQGASEQASSVQELNATMQTINEASFKNAKDAANAHNLSAGSKSNAEKGDRDMKAMLSAMNDIKNSSDGISKIIKVIEDIAFQINLLALNAAIEAARAGDHGKGFAVVSEEVRNLAGRSQTAALETSALIEESIAHVREGANIADITAETLKTIIENVAQITDIIKSVAEASKEQSTAVSQMMIGINQITSVVSDNSATSEEAASASQQLSSQSEIMRNLVGVFRLKP